MLQRRRYSKKGDRNATKKIFLKGDGNATKKKIFQKGVQKCYKEENIPKRGTEMIQRRRYSKKGDGNAKKKKIFEKRGMVILQRRYSKKGDNKPTKKKIFQKGGRNYCKEEDIP